MTQPVAILNSELIEDRLSLAIIKLWLQSDITTIGFTATEQPSDDDLALCEGCDVYIIKPRMTTIMLADIIAKSKSTIVFSNIESTIMSVQAHVKDTGACAAAFGAVGSFVPSIVWRTLFPGTPEPVINAILADSALQNRENPDSIYLRSFLTNTSVEDSVYDDLLTATDEDLEPLIKSGRLIRASRTCLIKNSCKTMSRVVRVGTTDMHICGSLPMVITDTAELMGAVHGIGAAYYDTATHRRFSVVSSYGVVDAGAICRSFPNGRGNTRTGVFRVTRDHPLAQA